MCGASQAGLETSKLWTRGGFLLACAAGISGCVSSRKEVPLQTAAPPPPPMLRTLDHFALPGPLYYQRDPRWAKLSLGQSRHTIESGGCMVCCVAMALCHLGIDADPLKLCAFLNRNGGFTGSGDLIWAGAAAYTGGEVKIGYMGKPDPRLIDDCLQRAEPVIAKVYLDGRSQHWVLIVGKKDGEYLIRDPLSQFNEVQRLSWVAPEVSAIRVFERGEHTRLTQAAPALRQELQPRAKQPASRG
jgi:hypothetical protein